MARLSRITRRQAIVRAGVGLGLPLVAPRAAIAGANDRIAVAAIGVGNRATMLLDQLPDDGRLVLLCDCNLPRTEAYNQKRQIHLPVVQDYRRVLDRKDVDAVIVGTREHQRVLPCIQACQAGKDVYAEKPLSLYIREGRELCKAVRKHGRVLQVGSQQRSMEVNRVACEFLRRGGLGKLTEVRAVNYSGPAPLPKQPLAEQPMPTGLDWDIWLSQAAWRPYNGAAMGGFLDLCGGLMTNWGAHGIDQVQWALDADDAGPVEMWPITPGLNGQVGMRYRSGLELLFVIDKGPMGGAVFIGEQGKLEINRNKVTSNPPEIAAAILAKVDLAHEQRKWSDQTAVWQARWHLQNWLDCIRTRAKPTADVEIGHRSISVCHLANIVRRLGRKLRWDPQAEIFPDDVEANVLVDWPRRKGWELPAI